MMRWTISLAAAIAIGGFASPLAHHSISSVYDSTRQVTIEGIVSQFQLVNPHAFLFIDVKDDAGKAERGGSRWTTAASLSASASRPPPSSLAIASW